MSAHKFSKKEAIKFGWSNLKSNFWFFIGLILFVWIVNFVLGYLSNKTEDTFPLLSFLIFIISWAISIVLTLGLIKISLDFAFNIKGKFTDLFSQYRLFFKYLIASILYGLIVAAGFILFIIPGIIWGIKFYFFTYFIVDKKLGPIESLKESSRVTAGAKWDLFLFAVLITLMNIAGALVFGIGLLITVPISMVATAFVYHKLLIYGAELAKTPE